jgi:hypothetical protein
MSHAHQNASSRVRAALVVSSLIVTGAVTAALDPAAQALSNSAQSVATRTVTAGPAQLTVPASWAVDSPAKCVRFDRNALYVGHADPSAVCPAAAVGRTEAVQVEPLDAAVDATAGATLSWQQLAANPAAALNAADNAYVVAVPDLGILITAGYAGDPATIEAVLRSLKPAATPARWSVVSTSQATAATSSARQTAAAQMSASAQATGTRAASAQSNAAPFNGMGFDACTAPSESTMAAWLSSPYRSIGIYIGGADRACGDGNLSASWVTNVRAMGWRLIPIYVGLQAPCWAAGGGKINGFLSPQQGTDAANDAVSDMQRFGLPTGSPVYFDMEAYDRTNSMCALAVRNFLTSWTARLHARSFRSAVYSSSGSGIADLVTWYGASSPDDVWFANWNGQATTSDPYIPSTMWTQHQRMHQYRGDHNETWSGRTINVDSNKVDADVVGDPSRQSSPQTPVLPPLPPSSDVFHSLDTARVYDTGPTPLDARADRTIQIVGLGGIPTSNVDAVVLNVEVENPSNAGYIRLTPGGYTTQTAVQEFVAGQTVSGLTQVRLSAGGTIKLHLSAGHARVFLDTAGYFSPSGNGATYHPLPTTRIYGVGSAPLAAGVDQEIQVAGLYGVPSTGVGSVVVNVETQNPTQAGYVRTTPGGKSSRTATQEFWRNWSISNVSVVSISADGKIRLHLSAGAAAPWVDLVGFYSGHGTPGDRYHPITPTRAYGNLTLKAGTDQDIDLTGLAGVPASGVNSVVVNVEVQDPSTAGYIRVTPGGTDSQTAVQEFWAHQSISNLVTVKVDTQGRARLHLSAGSAIIFLDVIGFTSAA